MKPFVKVRLSSVGLSFATMLCATSTAFAVNPVNSWYAGLLLGPSYTPKQSFTFISPVTGGSTSGSLSHSVMGNIAGFGGYRCNHWRAEGELMLNYNPYSSLKIGSFTINKTSSSSTGFGLKGQTTTAAFMVNGYYDFFSESSYFSPYVGLGVGYAMLRSNIKFYFADTYITGSSVSNNSSSPAAQLILGLGYFMDDYTTIGLDYRYFTTKTIQPYNTRNQINSINITLSGSF